MNRFFALAGTVIIFGLAGCGKNSTQISAVPSFTPWPNLRPDEECALTAGRMKQLGLAVMVYTQRNGETLPDLSSSQTMQNAVFEYIEGAGNELFIHPLTGEAFTPNPSVSKLSLNKIPDTSRTPLFYEATPTGNKTRAIVFCDGHFKRLSEENWQSFKTVTNTP